MIAYFLRTVRLGLKSLTLHKLRSSLAMLGILIGVMAVIWLVALGEGVSYQAQEQIKATFANRPDVEIYVYPGQDHAFARTMGEHYNKPAANLAHSRSIALFRRVMGPKYDLSGLWDKHCEYEFGTRDVAATMKTMVAEPYVNHIPTMTGGVGQQELARFYPKLGDSLKRRFAGWRCYIFTADLRLPKLIRLEPSRRTPLWNGALECRLYEFEMVSGRHRR